MRLQHRIELSLTLSIALLTACSSAINVVAQATNTPQPTITPTVITMDQKVEAFLSGEFDDVSNLSLEERKEFSILLAQKMNEARGAKPLIYNNKAYVDPATGMMRNYDGHPDLEETIQMYLAVALDEEGNLLVQNEEGTWVQINGSKDIDWKMVVTDPNDPRIDWPTGNENSKGLSPAKSSVNVGAKLVPMVLVNNTVNQLYLSGENGLMQPTINMVDIVTDKINIPILARKVIVHSNYFSLCEEGSDLYITQNMFDSWADGFQKTKEQSVFFNNLKGNQTYYIVMGSDQPIAYKYAKLIQVSDDYENAVQVDNVWQTLNNQTINTTDMLVILAQFLIEAK